MIAKNGRTELMDCKHPEEKRRYDYRRTDGFVCGRCGRWIQLTGFGGA